MDPPPSHFHTLLTIGVPVRSNSSLQVNCQPPAAALTQVSLRATAMAQSSISRIISRLDILRQNTLFKVLLKKVSAPAHRRRLVETPAEPRSRRCCQNWSAAPSAHKPLRAPDPSTPACPTPRRGQRSRPTASPRHPDAERAGCRSQFPNRSSHHTGHIPRL